MIWIFPEYSHHNITPSPNIPNPEHTSATLYCHRALGTKPPKDVEYMHEDRVTTHYELTKNKVKHTQYSHIPPQQYQWHTWYIKRAITHNNYSVNTLWGGWVGTQHSPVSHTTKQTHKKTNTNIKCTREMNRGMGRVYRPKNSQLHPSKHTIIHRHTTLHLNTMHVHYTAHTEHSLDIHKHRDSPPRVSLTKVYTHTKNEKH